VFITNLSLIDKDHRDGQNHLRRSRLELYEDILEALVNRPLSQCQLAKEAHIDHFLLIQYLESLLRSGLVEERADEGIGFYAITEKGSAVIKVLDFHKYLRKIKGAIRTIEEAVQIIPEISNREDDLERFSE
jgi:predicted transcriptional regulator